MALKKNLSDLAQEAREGGVPEVDVDELAKMIDQPADEDERPIVIDVREADERARGYIGDSVHIPRGTLERDIEKKAFGPGAGSGGGGGGGGSGHVSDAQLDRPIVTYCGGGSRSLLAAASLRQMGFTDVYSLSGGFKAWALDERPVEVERSR